MKTISIFCIIGKTGDGKNTYFDAISKDYKFMEACNISSLVYGTTRQKRQGEEDGISYHFHTLEEFNKIDDNDMIEFRSYHTINDGVVYYFTMNDYFKIENNIICTASPYQYERYRTWCMNENIKYPGKYSLNMILINTELHTRIRRVLERVENDDDIYELCRRVVEERVEFGNVSKKLPELLDPIMSNNVCFINNNKDGKDAINKNLSTIKGFIRDTIK